MPGASPSRKVAQAVDALRHGWPVKVGEAPLLLPVETAMAKEARSDLALISAARAATLKLCNQREAAGGHHPVLIRSPEPLGLADALPIADPALDLSGALKGPFKVEPIACMAEAEAAMELARIAGILPAFLFGPKDAREAGAPLTLEASDIAFWADPERLSIATRARLPITASEEAEIVAFRKTDDMREHVALVIGDPNHDKVPLVRLHSECLTGDIFSSLKCDCGPQLDAALAAMAEEEKQGGWGILLYLRQEGRGIGIINKMRAYRLQDAGFDTVDANARLGLPVEARDFATAARMLDLLGAETIRLMTNNPAKVEALEGAGLTIAERVQHQLPANPHNMRYLDTKRDRSGHLLR